MLVLLIIITIGVIIFIGGNIVMSARQRKRVEARLYRWRTFRVGKFR